MKALKYKILAVCLILMGSIGVQAQDKYEKTYNEEFEIDESGLFEISNKFGDINIENTAEDKISIYAEVIVKARSKEKADKILNRIDVTISQVGNKVLAETSIDDVSGNNISFEINYKVKMPSYLNINLVNKYGHVTINELDGKSNLAVKYGSLNVNKISDGKEKPLSSIELGYCELSTINEFNWGKLIVKYSKVSVEKGKALIVSSKYSKVTLGDFSSVVVEASYDDYNITSVANLVMESKYSDLNVSTLSNKFKIDNKYGNIRVNNVTTGFEDINVKSKYSNVSLGINALASYKLDASTEYAEVKHGELVIRERIKESHGYSVKGTANGGGKATVYVRSEYGDVDLRP